jgi:two-component system, LuxR family, response regulator TtrR
MMGFRTEPMWFESNCLAKMKDDPPHPVIGIGALRGLSPTYQVARFRKDHEMTDVTVLVVDDELPIRNMVQDILRSTGYAVLTASNGEEALNIFREHFDLIGCLVTDCRMPGMSGPQLAENLIRVRPGLPVIFMSGADAGPAGYPLLTKPFTAAQVSKCVRDVISKVNLCCAPFEKRMSEAVAGQQRRICEGSDSARRDLNSLTPREEEVLVLLAEGYSTRKAARQLGITFKTAACHRARIYSKLEVHGVVGMLRYAIRHGMISA